MPNYPSGYTLDFIPDALYDLSSHVVSGTLLTPFVTGIALTTVSAAVAYYGFHKGFPLLGRLSSQLSHGQSSNKATFLGDSLDFDQVHSDGKTLVGKSGSLTRVFVVKGKDYGLCTTDVMVDLHKQRTRFFDDVVAKEGLRISIFTDRVAVQTGTKGDIKENPSNEAFENPYLQRIHDLWEGGLCKSHVNEHTIVVSRSPSRIKTSSLSSMLPSFSSKGSKQQSQNDHFEPYDESETPHVNSKVNKGRFDDVCEMFLSYLDAYDVEELTLTHDISKPFPLSGRSSVKAQKPLKNPKKSMSPLLSYWGRKINGDGDLSLIPHKSHLSDHLAGASVSFDLRRGVIAFDDNRFATIVSVNQWGENSDGGLLRDLLSCPCELSLLYHVKGLSKAKSQLYLERHKSNTGGLIKGLTSKKYDEFSTAFEIIENDEGRLLKLQLSVILYGTSVGEVQSQTKRIRTLFQSYGINAIQEKRALEAVWRSQFPDSDHYIRESTLLSQNVSDLSSFAREPEDRLHSPWGRGPIRSFPTLTGGSFPVNIHDDESSDAVGHNVVIAPTKTGKTTFIQHMVAGALRHPDLRAFLFDRLNGMRIFTESCGGTYVDTSRGHNNHNDDATSDNNSNEAISLNPFVGLESAGDHQRFRTLLGLMSDLPSDQIPDEDLSSLLDLLGALPPELRCFKHIHKELLPPQSLLSDRLRPWADGSYDTWFNGQKDGKAFDALSLEAHRLVGFEMTAVMKEPRVVGPVVYYLFERIMSLIQNNTCPAWIVIDEAHPLLKVPEFRRYAEVMLREFRKLGGAVTLCFQHMGDLHDSGFGSVIQGQCKTYFLFPDKSAEYEDYAFLKLTQSEWAYIKGEHKLANKFKHTVLVKKPDVSVILNVDLASLGPYLNLYSSNSNNVLRAQSLQQQHRKMCNRSSGHHSNDNHKGGLPWVDSYLGL